MAKYLKLIGLLIFALALWHTAGSTSIEKVGEEEDMSILHAAASHQKGIVSFVAPQSPYLPDAELAGANAQTHLMNSLRIQRLSTTESLFLLKDWPERLAQRDALFSLHREKLYDASAYYCYQPVCEYYIFALRRILI